MAKFLQPFFHFSNSEQEQREQLHKNPLMQEYRRLRAEARQDSTNPSYHFFAPDSRINDPNGLCYWNGQYHLFYQQYPPACPVQHWGHAVSRDMVHWRDLPTAIYPDIEEACYSGSTFVEEDRVIAMYHGRGIGNMIAFSRDPLLLNWEKHPCNPVIPHLPDQPEAKLPYRVFDPFLWKEEDGYYALSGKYLNGMMKEFLFFSQDLARWTFLGSLMEENPFVEYGNDGACPYFLPFGEQERILFFFSHSSGTRCLIGPYDKITHRFSPRSCTVFSQDSVAVSSLIAPCAISDGNGGVYVIYNIGDSLPTKLHRGMFTLMRHITPDDCGGLLVKPASQNESLRKKLIYDGAFSLPANTPTVWKPMGARIELEVELCMNEARAVEVKVLCSRDFREYTSVAVIRGKNRNTPCGYLSINTLHASLRTDVVGRIPDSTRFPCNGSEVTLRIFVDNCIVEAFANNHAAIAQLAYASQECSNGITLEAIGGNAEIKHLRVWEMDSIYHDDTD